MKKDIVSDKKLVAYCGLYCGACGSYLKGQCPGCHDNAKAAWCKIRGCCREQGYSSCADCGDFADPMQCKKYNNFIAKIIGFVLHSDRAACIAQIRHRGLKGHADIMARRKLHTIKK